MTRATGSHSQLIFAEEAVWGTTPTDVATKVFGLNMRSESLGFTMNTFQSEMINQYRSVIGLASGNRGIAGNIVSDLLPEGMEVLFKHLLTDTVTPPTTNSDSRRYTHQFKGSASNHPGLSIQKVFTSLSAPVKKYFLYKGCRVNSMNVNIIQEGFHDITWDFVGKDESILATDQMPAGNNPVYPTKNGFTGYEVQIWIDSGAGYALVGNCVSGNILINNSIETDGYVLGSATRASAEYQKRECSGEFSMFFENTTLYELFIASQEIGLRYVFTDALTGLDSMTFEFPKVKLSGESPKIASVGGINMPIRFNARRDATALTDVIITLVNEVVEVGTP